MSNLLYTIIGLGTLGAFFCLPYLLVTSFQLFNWRIIEKNSGHPVYISYFTVLMSTIVIIIILFIAMSIGSTIYAPYH